MTARKELFLKVKDQLKTIPQLEWVDYFRNQFGNQQWTAAFVQIGKISWQTMVENKQEGNCTVDILFFSRDGWMDQHQLTDDPEGGLMEIDVIDSIVEKLQFLKGEYFKPLELADEEGDDISEKGVMSYRLSFETLVYRRVKYGYTPKKLNLNTN